MIGETRFKIGRSGQKPYEQPGSKAESNDQREEQSGVIHRRKNRIEKLHHRSSLNSASNKRLYYIQSDEKKSAHD
jgi:hypothetical protein